MKILEERGFVIPAFNTTEVDYEFCASKLKTSILKFHPNAHVTILTNKDLMHDKQVGYANDWQVYHLSPYRQTIKLEADMLMASPCIHWFDMMQHRDVVVSTGARDFYGDKVTSRYYRKIFDDNHLPDVYNAVTYWRVSQTAKDFFKYVKDIFLNWQNYKTLLKFPETTPSTDVVYAIAAVLIGPEKCTMPFSSFPKIVHMKRYLNPINHNDWTKELVWEFDPLRIQTVAQWGAFHYHSKSWLK